MAWLCLFCTLMGLTAAILVTVSQPSISISTGKDALLPASLNFPPSVPNYFQLRWRFVTGSRLVLKLKAYNCIAGTATQHWRDSCEVSIEVAERYRQRAELSAEDASMALRDVRAEDSGIYSITVLALDMTSTALINLTVTKEDLNIPVSFMRASDGRDFTVSNSIRLGVAGLILCILGLIIAQHISFTHNMDGKITDQDERETDERDEREYRAAIESMVVTVPGPTNLLMKNTSSDELHCSINC